MPITLAEFKRFFALGDGVTALRPNGFFVYHVPKNKKVVITDIYLRHVSGGNVSVSILEQTGATTYQVRYRFYLRPDETLSLNLSTGLRLGQDGPLFDEIRLLNDDHGPAVPFGEVVPIVCGRLVG
jgi:hypothetical protein